MNRGLAALLLLLVGCASFAALGRAVERAAYPTAGAVTGAALGGPPGAAAGAAAGHLLGGAVLQERIAQNGTAPPTTMALGGGVRVQTTYFGLSLASWLAVAVAGLLFRFLPWLPGVLYRWFRDVLDQRENNGQEKTPPPG